MALMLASVNFVIESDSSDALLCREVSADLKLLLSSLDPSRPDELPWRQISGAYEL